TFQISDAQYAVTFFVMLGVGLLIANLTTRLRDLADAARSREQSTSRSYDMVRGLAAARTREEAGAVAARHVRDTFSGDVTVLVGSASAAGPLATLASAGRPEWLDDRERSVAQWAFDHAKVAGRGTRALPGSAGRFIPLSTTQGKVGVLAVHCQEPFSTQQLLLLDTFANQIALALERVQLIDAQHAARVEAESERLRAALLRSVSHDLRTPLATISGAASTLQQPGLDEATRTQLTQSIVEESDSLTELIANLVFATRLESGISLRKEWLSVEEIVGIGLSRHRGTLAPRPLRILVPADLPLVRVDNAMLPQVIHNLVDNALRYSPADSPIEIAAWTTDTSVVIKVADEGPGLSGDEFRKVFERFYRGKKTHASGPENSLRSGMGLGLTICEGIVKAHNGRIWVEPNVPRGAAFLLSVPREPSDTLPPTETTSASVSDTPTS
ncbi:MAG: GAF domain-containing protein, partial [Planctomycetes bacterium]|nr:GAF domain-containing protein [Planctomycetota bacterium]